jgi:hypothetical protein
MSIDNATPQDWDRLRKEHPAILISETETKVDEKLTYQPAVLREAFSMVKQQRPCTGTGPSQVMN